MNIGEMDCFIQSVLRKFLFLSKTFSGMKISIYLQAKGFFLSPKYNL